MRKDNEALMLEFEALHRTVDDWLDSSKSRFESLNVTADSLPPDSSATEAIKVGCWEVGCIDVKKPLDSHGFYFKCNYNSTNQCLRYN